MTQALKPLSEQIIVITGASSGIGLATAKMAAKAGAKLVLAARDADTLASIVQDLTASGAQVIHAVTDVSDRAEVEALGQAAIDAFGGFDSWVNNAGVGLFGELLEVPEDDARALFDTNFWGVVNGTLVAAAHLRQSGGAIINLGSVASDAGFPVQGMYSASKHAVKGFTDSFRIEMRHAKAPVAVSLIKPAAIGTPFASHAANHTGGRPELPPPVYTAEDVAAAILHAATHGGRDYYVGSASRLMSGLNKWLPGAMDWLGASFVQPHSVGNRGYGQNDAGNLRAPGLNGRTAGETGHFARPSLSTQASLHPVLTGAAAAGACLAVLGLLNRRA